MRSFRLLLSAVFLLGCFGGEAIAADKGKPPSDPQKKTNEQSSDSSDKPEKKSGGFAVKVGKKGSSSRSDSSGKGSHHKDSKDPF